MNRTITNETLTAFRNHLTLEERSPATVEKYLRDVRSFALWLGKRPLAREEVLRWKEEQSSRAPSTVNAALSALNSLLRLLGREDCRVKFVKAQRRAFREQEKELTREEFQRLVAAAEATGKPRLSLLLETIGSTGVRVSEVKFITVEAAQKGETAVTLKSKTRTVLLPGKLCRKLLKYAKKHKIASGEIFITRSGRSLSRRQIWAEMKALCKRANVLPSKVFPHNLRHLFATVFYRACRDLVKLADVLGHSSIETTRIYLISSGAEHRRQLDRLRLVS